MLRAGFGLLALGLAFLVLGCSGGPPVGEVGGVVTAGGQPLDKIQVEFFPTSDGPTSIGVTDASGKFSLKTSDNRPGAMVGKHKVVLRDVGIWGERVGRMNEGKDLSKGKKIRIPAQFSDIKTTPLNAEVKTGSKNTVSLEVK